MEEKREIKGIATRYTVWGMIMGFFLALLGVALDVVFRQDLQLTWESFSNTFTTESFYWLPTLAFPG